MAPYTGRSASWFSVTMAPDTVQVAIHGPETGRYWPLDVMREMPLPTESWEGRRVVVTGQGSVVLYAHVGAVAARNGASGITVKQAQGTITHTPADVRGNRIALGRITRLDRGATVVGWDLPRPPAKTRGLESLVSEIPMLVGTLDVVLAGRAPVGLYAAAAFAAVRDGVATVRALSMIDGVVVVHAVDRSRLGAAIVPVAGSDLARACGTSPTARGVALGVVGDPNCGKSVLSQAIDSARGVAGIRGWRFDCDLAAPTAEWFLELVGQDRELEARQLRDPGKLEWTPALEKAAADRLQVVKANAGLVVADLPGGRHYVDPPVRIPSTRQGLFRTADHFVLLGRDSSGHEAWRRELKTLGLTDRIYAEIVSRDPTGVPEGAVELGIDGVWRGTFSGLDRSQRMIDLLAGLAPALTAFLLPLDPESADAGNAEDSPSA
jgi:hypothetical protein